MIKNVCLIAILMFGIISCKSSQSTSSSSTAGSTNSTAPKEEILPTDPPIPVSKEKINKLKIQLPVE